MGDFVIHLLPLPTKVRALTIPDENGDYTIIVNSNLNDELKQKALAHEINHIRLNHFTIIMM